MERRNEAKSILSVDDRSCSRTATRVLLPELSPSTASVVKQPGGNVIGNKAASVDGVGGQPRNRKLQQDRTMSNFVRSIKHILVISWSMAIRMSYESHCRLFALNISTSTK